MPLSRHPIVIISEELFPSRDGVASDERFLVEQDCACPDDGFALNYVAENHGEAPAYLLPWLHIGGLTENFTLAFNPLTSSGPIVLNQAALTLLRAFQQPRALADGVLVAGDPPDGLAMARRLADLHLIEPADVRHSVQRSSPRTLTIWLHVTNECNLRCPYCYVQKTPDDMELDRGRQAVEAVFRSAVAQGFRRVKLKYAGGEATLNFHTVLILHDHARSLAEQHGLELEGVVLSNGVALSNRMIDELRARRLRLMISLDGIGEYHDAQRHFANGHGSFAHVERALDRMAAQNFKPSISITLSSRNLSGLPAVVDYVLRRELPFTLNFYRESECSATFADLAYADEQIIAAMKAAFAVIEANLPPYSLLGTLVDRARLDAPHDRPCGVGHSYMVIDQRGGVAHCQMEIEQTVTDVSAPDPLGVLRESQIGVRNLPVEAKEGCRDCSWRYWCAGGCPALTYRVTGRFDIKSPNCRIYKALFPEVLRLEGLRLLKYSGILVA